MEKVLAVGGRQWGVKEVVAGSECASDSSFWTGATLVQ